MPESGRGTVAFIATGDHDVHVAIAAQDGAGGSLYEVVIGGSGNTRSVIRLGAQGTELAVAPSGLKAPGKPNPLWISVDSATGWIKVGRGTPGQDVFLSYQDPTFIAGVRYVTFSSWDVAIDYSQVSTLTLDAVPSTPILGYGLWRLTEVCNVPAESGAYDWSRPPWRLQNGRGVFAFTIDNNDAYILITPTGGSGSAGYEIILGGWNNTLSVIRRGAGGPTIASAPVGLTTPGGRNAFWVSIDDRTGIIQVGRNAPGQDVFIFFVDPVLRSAAPVGQRFVYLTTYSQPIFFSNLAVSPITPNVSLTAPAAPGVNHQVWMANLPIPGSTRWVAGCGVRYAVAFELPNGSELRGPWWSIAGSDTNGYYRPSYACPTLTNISVDASRKAVARRIYRQFLGEATESLVGRIPNNVDTTYGDGDAAMATMGRFSNPANNLRLGARPDGSIYGHANRGAWETWRIDDAGNGEVFLVSQHGTVLGSRADNSVYMTTNRQAWERWRLESVGAGQLLLTSAAHGLHLGVRPDGSVYTHANTAVWERWVRETP